MRFVASYQHDLAVSQTLDCMPLAQVHGPYESAINDMGVVVWKLREFEELEDVRTRVRERIEGSCPRAPERYPTSHVHLSRKWVLWVLSTRSSLDLLAEDCRLEPPFAPARRLPTSLASSPTPL